MLVRIILIIVVLQLLSACTTELNAIRIRDANDFPVSGAPYNLTFTQFELDVVHQIHCFDVGAITNLNARGKIESVLLPKVVVTTTVGIKKNEVKDPDHAYVIDFSSVESFFKTSELKVDYYENGALKSINGSVEDRASEFASSVIKTVGETATPFVAGLGNLSAEAPHAVAESEWRCNPKTASAAERLIKNELKIKDLSAAILEKTSQFQQYSELLGTIKMSLSSETSKRLKILADDIVNLQVEKRNLQSEVDADVENNSVKQNFKWPRKGDEFFSEGGIGQLDNKEVARWVLPVRNTMPSFSTGFYLQISRGERMAVTVPSCNAKICEMDGVAGIKYRIPALGLLSKCNDPEIDGKTLRFVSCKKPEVLVRNEPIGQLGKLYVLPLKSKPFGKRSISISFTESGVPASIGITNSSSADKAANAGNTLGTNISSISKSNAERETNQLEAKIKLLTLRKQYEEAQAGAASGK